MSISFRDDEEELHDWVEEQKEDGPYRSKTAVVIDALKKMRDDNDSKKTKDEWKA